MASDICNKVKMHGLKSIQPG